MQYVKLLKIYKSVKMQLINDMCLLFKKIYV